MMYIPRKLKFMGHTYSVVNDIEQTVAAGDFAQLDHVAHEVRIYKNMHEDQRGESFVHEMVHLICDKLAIDFPEEDNVVRFGSGLYALMKDNGIIKTEEDKTREKTERKKKKPMGFETKEAKK